MSNATPTNDSTQYAADDAASLKRKRSPSLTQQPLSAPPAKTAKSNANHLSINYLARSSNEDLPLANKEDTLPNLLRLLGLYSSVLDRHESLASNLGARPLGPILIKKFERCFDTTPKIVASHHKTAIDPNDSSLSITWLEVIEFARSHPAQFTLSTFSEGQRVCQFYLPQKQFRVQISEEDYLFINSGRCQELIPPLPIWEDEEKEVSTCDVLETRLKELTNVADMVAARTRQLCHRLKMRRGAILERRAEGGSGTPAKAGTPQTTTTHPSSSGFTAVNTTNGHASAEELAKSSASMRTDLLRHFESLPQNQSGPTQRKQHLETPTTHAKSSSPSAPTTNQHDNTGEGILPSSAVSNARRQSLTNSTPSKHNFSKPLPAAMESSQPFRILCQAHMDALPRGQRVLPPCDRCRRLRMDCVKNLTSCAGCTKKHARCHWRDVNKDELRDLDHNLIAGTLTQDSLNDNDKSTTDEHSESGAESDEDALALVQRVGEHAEKEHAEELARRAAQRPHSRSDGAPEQGDGVKLLNAFDTSSHAVPRRLTRDESASSFHPHFDHEGTVRGTKSPVVAAMHNGMSDNSTTVAKVVSLGGFRPVNPVFAIPSSTTTTPAQGPTDVDRPSEVTPQDISMQQS